ncbi:hypothetical protein G6F70_004812 [Rhizopus microsporus]|uniref:Galactose oxidase n=2 Tax=Rhizopus TaxID=4842 RepID=A0A367KCA9_RHIAZ|nr:hypothetical protein G6F71_006459 [Rhizopus microsporus]RCH99864.1 hypothetical protein CU097_001392 [Rhizopus azygosporus]KAG1199572.1 hypothetical protein G6F70_004812 [Rhizopus microsporus]KAG1209591.1 hypothetical protein G6F69_006212 [Rhizopus microsporus]KAG1231028.1 hypothetical protein G6F67_006040 [Rhizopus microsporus]
MCIVLILRVLFIHLCCFSKVDAITLPGRIYPVCAYLKNQIYCYGGNQTPIINVLIDPELYTLNLSKTQLLDQLDWEPVKVKNDFVPEKRLQTQFAVLSKGTQLLLEGGRHEVRFDNTIVNDTIIYDALENIWKPVSNNSQLIDTDAADNGVTVNLPLSTGDRVLFFRGPKNSKNATSCSEGSSLTEYSTISNTWSNFTLNINIPTNAISIGSSATLDQKSGIVYFFGGARVDSSCNNNVYLNFTTGTTFNTKNGIWSQNNYTSNDGRFPSPRAQFTTVLAPNSRHIILYGGQNDNEVVSDYLYTLNLDNNTWTHVNLNATGQVLTRAYHSAVLVNTTLFILFGYQTKGALAAGSIALDVSDVTNIQLLNQYPPSIENTTTQQQPSTTLQSPMPPKTLSAGAKAGIAIGAIIGAAIIFGVAFLLYRKRAKRLAQSAYQAQKEEDIKDPDALDWDKIENEHIELKRPPALNQLKTNSSLVRLTPDADPNSTYSIHKAEDISQTPDARL